MEPDLAPYGRRFAAFWLDYMLSLLFLAPWVAVVLAGPEDPEEYPLTFYIVLMFALLVAALLTIAYLEGVRGASPGKRVLGLQVVDFDLESKIGWPRAIGRRVLVGLQLAFWPIYAWVLIDRWRRGLHEFVVDSVVVRAPAPETAPTPSLAG